MAFAVKAEITGLEDVFRGLREVDAKVRKKLLRKAISKANHLILMSARAKVARRSGLLAKALGQKTKVYRDSGVVVGIVGPRTGFKQRVTAADGSTVMESPTNIAHLVEKGRRGVSVRTKKVLSSGKTVFGVSVKAVPARPFMRPAFDENKAEAEQIIRETILQGLEE